MSETTDAVNALQATAQDLFDAVVAAQASIDDAVAATDADRITVANDKAIVAADKAIVLGYKNEADADRIAAETAQTGAANSAIAAAASAASAADPNARVSAISEAYGYFYYPPASICFKSKEGWEKSGNQSFRDMSRPTGRFIGWHGDHTAAWAANYEGVASVNGDYYVRTDGVIYELSGGSSATKIWRAGSDDFPTEAVFIGIGGDMNSYPWCRILIFDTSKGQLEPWGMIGDFEGGAHQFMIGIGPSSAGGIKPASMHFYDGRLYILQTRIDGAVQGCGMAVVDFKNDRAFARHYDTMAEWTSRTAGVMSPYTVGYKFITYRYQSGSKWFPRASMHMEFEGDKYVVHNTYSNANESGVCIFTTDFLNAYYSSPNSETCYGTTIWQGRVFGHTINGLKDYGPLKDINATAFTAKNTYGITTYSLNPEDFLYLSSNTEAVYALTGAGLNVYWPDPSQTDIARVVEKQTTYATGVMRDDTVLMTLCESPTGSVSDTGVTELVTNGDFATDVSGWTDGFGGGWVTWDASGKMLLSQGAVYDSMYVYQTITTVVGQTYRLSFDTTDTGFETASLMVSVNNSESYPNVATLAKFPCTVGGTKIGYFTATATTTYLMVGFASSSNNISALVDNISVKTCLADRSGLTQALEVVGTLDYVQQVTGSCSGLTGFSTTDYIEGANVLDGIGSDPHYGGMVVDIASSAIIEPLIEFGYWTGAAWSNAYLAIRVKADGYVELVASNDGLSSNVTITSNAIADRDEPISIIWTKTATAYNIYVNGHINGTVAVGSHGNLTFHASATMMLGKKHDDSQVATNTTIFQPFVGLGTLTPAEIRLMHKVLMANATTRVVLTEVPERVVHNPHADLIDAVGTTYSQILRGVTIESSAHGYPAIPRQIEYGLRGEKGVVCNYWNPPTNGAFLDIPERSLRDYVPTSATIEKTVKYEGDASRTQFPLQSSETETEVVFGYKPVRVSNAGSIKTEGVSDDYTVETDGLGNYWVEFAVAPGSGNDVVVEWRREILA